MLTTCPASPPAAANNPTNATAAYLELLPPSGLTDILTIQASILSGSQADCGNRIVPPVHYDATAQDLDKIVAGAENLALQEIALLTRFDGFQYPREPNIPAWHRTTAATPLQKICRFIDGYCDDRGLKEADGFTHSSGLGPLTLSIGAAVFRNSIRNGHSPAPVLEIGAGQRLAARALKQHLFGDVIRTCEISPVYAELSGAIDEELPAGFIDDVTLPGDSFDLVFSLFGSLYGRDQVGILQNVIDSLRVGAETFLMWKPKWLWLNRENERLSALAMRWPSVFQRGGVDLTIVKNFHAETIGSLKGISIHALWARKRKDVVQVHDLFREVEELDRQSNADRNKRPDGYEPMVRLSQHGSYFPSSTFNAKRLKSLVQQIIGAVCEELGVEATRLEHVLTGTDLSTCKDSGEEIARHNIANYAIAEMSKSRLHAGVPLTTLVYNEIRTAINLLHSGITQPQYIEQSVQMIRQLTQF